MAKFTFKRAAGELQDPMADVLFVDIVAQSTKKIVLADNDGDKLVYSGHNFSFDNGVAIGGTVTKVEVFENGKLLMSITDARFKLAELDLDYVHNNDHLFSKGDDIFIGSSIGDYMFLYGPNFGDDIIKTMGGNDRIFASPGSNTIDGGAGNRDILEYAIFSPASNLKQGIDVNMVTGKIINPWNKTDEIKNIEVVYGSYLNDRFLGSNRDDVFGGYIGNDRLTGGKGDDDFEFYNMIPSGESDGRDTITDFGNGNDTVILGGYVSSFSDLKPMMKQTGSDLHIVLGGGQEIIFLDIRKSELKSSDFEFVV